MELKIGAVILAAGGSQRFGSPKQLLMIEGQPMLQRVINLVSTIDFYRIVLVLGAHKKAIESRLTMTDRMKVVYNPNWLQGQGGSVRMGLEALEQDCDAVIFFLGDQPFLSKELVEREIAVYTEKKPEILVPVFDGARGNPVLFDRVCFSDLMELHGDQGGKAIFPRHHVEEILWSDVRESRDIDTRSDYGGAT